MQVPFLFLYVCIINDILLFNNYVFFGGVDFMEYRHYHNGEFMFNKNRIYPQTNTTIVNKPKGLWFSVGDSWEQWLEEQGYCDMIDNYPIYTNLTINNANNILFLRKEKDFNNLLKEFGTKPYIHEITQRPTFKIFWEDVTSRYDGIIIDVLNDWLYYYGFGMGHIPCNFIEAWDCLSGVIWNLKGADVSIN